MATVRDEIRQAAAIPVQDGRVCLVLSSNGRRWVIPKGYIEPGQTAGETALREAWEEAGLLGALQSEPVGTYRYEKSGRQFHVTVFWMDVTDSAKTWPEQGWRQRRWLSPVFALQELVDAGLRKLLSQVLAAKPNPAPNAERPLSPAFAQIGQRSDIVLHRS